MDKETVQCTIRLPPALWKEVREKALSLGISANVLVRLVLGKYLHKEGGKEL